MSAILDQDVGAFETHRRALTGLANRMLGSRAEADDEVDLIPMDQLVCGFLIAMAAWAAAALLAVYGFM